MNVLYLKNKENIDLQWPDEESQLSLGAQSLSYEPYGISSQDHKIFFSISSFYLLLQD